MKHGVTASRHCIRCGRMRAMHGGTRVEALLMLLLCVALGFPLLKWLVATIVDSEFQLAALLIWLVALLGAYAFNKDDARVAGLPVGLFFFLGGGFLLAPLVWWSASKWAAAGAAAALVVVATMAGTWGSRHLREVLLPRLEGGKAPRYLDQTLDATRLITVSWVWALGIVGMVFVISLLTMAASMLFDLPADATPWMHWFWGL